MKGPGGCWAGSWAQESTHVIGSMCVDVADQLHARRWSIGSLWSAIPPGLSHPVDPLARTEFAHGRRMLPLLGRSRGRRRTAQDIGRPNALDLTPGMECSEVLVTYRRGHDGPSVAPLPQVRHAVGASVDHQQLR